MQSCQAACCRSLACNAFWLLGSTCVQVNCTEPQWCQAIWTDAADSVVVFITDPERAADLQPAPEGRGSLLERLGWAGRHQHKARLRRSFRDWTAQRRHLAAARGSSLKRDAGPSSGSPAVRPVPPQPPEKKPAHQDLANPPSSGQDTHLPRDVNSEKTLLLNSEDLRGSKSPNPSPPVSNNASRPSDLAGSGSQQVSSCLQTQGCLHPSFAHCAESFTGPFLLRCTSFVKVVVSPRWGVVKVACRARPTPALSSRQLLI